MPVRGLRETQSRVNATLIEIRGAKAKRALTEALIIGGGASDVLTPRDTSFLVNSRYRAITATKDGWSGRFGYAAGYAAAVHDAPGDNVGKGTPRDPSNPSRGVMWHPDAEPEFLAKGFEQSEATITAAVLRAMKI